MSPEAEDLLFESRIREGRRVFAERRNRFWRRAWPWLCMAAIFALWALDHATRRA